MIASSTLFGDKASRRATRRLSAVVFVPPDASSWRAKGCATKLLRIENPVSMVSQNSLGTWE